MPGESESLEERQEGQRRNLRGKEVVREIEKEKVKREKKKEQQREITQIEDRGRYGRR